MSEFAADVRDIKFVLSEQLDLDKLLATPRFSGFSRDDLSMIIDEGYKFAREVLAPMNVEGDRQGCKFENGKVNVPAAYHVAYKTMAESGWIGMNRSSDFGGQGMPDCLAVAVCQMFFGANTAFSLGPFLNSGNGHLIETFGSDEQKKIFVEKLYNGKWAGTMCLTEAGAGSDVGASKAKARRADDHFLIEGEKIFITFGEHDLTENIIHAVLARIEGAPAGTKGLSLFIVPKYRINPDGSCGELNDIVCANVEHKLGINSSPTCTIVFGQNGNCHGYLLGKEGEGMKAMFQLMIEARVSVGLQAAAIASAAYQTALQYTKERIQGPEFTRFREADAPKVPIINHPDVRMMLLRQKAYCDGIFAIVMFTAYCQDIEHSTADEATKKQFHQLTEMLTPICKAYCSDMGFRVTEWALQCHGGYGYLRDYMAEQYLRDAKIMSIYEGTNGIQALDLVGRKMSADGGANVMALAGHISKFIDKNKAHPQLRDSFASLIAARDAWASVNMHFVKAAMSQKTIVPVMNASTYLSLSGDLVVGYLLLEQAVISVEKLQNLAKAANINFADAAALAKFAADNNEANFYYGKIKTARFFAAQELPMAVAKANAIKSNDLSAIEMIWPDHK